MSYLQLSILVTAFIFAAGFIRLLGHGSPAGSRTFLVVSCFISASGLLIFPGGQGGHVFEWPAIALRAGIVAGASAALILLRSRPRAGIAALFAFLVVIHLTPQLWPVSGMAAPLGIS